MTTADRPRPIARLLAAVLTLALAPVVRGQDAATRAGALEVRWWADDASVHDLVRTADGLLWAATENGLLRLDGATATRFVPGPEPAEPGAGPRRAWAVEPDAAGTLVVGTDDGAYRFDGRRFVLLSRPGVSGRQWAAKLLLRDGERVLWVAAADTLLRLEPNAFSLRQGLPGVAVDLLWEDPFGYLWATTETGQVFRRLGNAFQPVNFPLVMGDIRVRCFHFDSTDGTLWLLRSDGAWRVEGDFAGAGLPRTARPLEPLRGVAVEACAADPSGGAWLATAQGLDFHAGDGSRARIPGIGPGVRTILAEPGGDVWVGTDRGIAQLHDPAAEPPLPRVLVTRAWVDGEELAPGDGYDLDAGAETLRLSIAVPDFHRHSEVRMRYRWSTGNDAASQEAGWRALTESELVLGELPAGQSRLVLQAGRGERWNPVVTELEIHREPAWWQTNAFWGAVSAAAGAVLVWLLYLRWAGPGLAPLGPPEEDDDVVHLEDLDTDELRLGPPTGGRRSVFADPPEDEP